MKKRIIIVLSVVLACILIGVIIYCLPVRVEKTFNMVSDDGTVIELKADVTFQRSLFRPTVLKGTITLDGVQYCDWESFTGRLPGYTSNYSWWDALRDKWSGIGVQATFAREDASDIIEATSHRIILFNVGPGCSLDHIELMLLDGNPDESGHVVGVHYRRQ